MFNFIDKIKGFFSKEDKEEFYPQHFLKVVVNPIAKSKGINDNFNKEILRIKMGVVVESSDYSPQLLKNMKEVYQIPVLEEVFDENEEYDYDSFNDISVVRYKK